MKKLLDYFLTYKNYKVIVPIIYVFILLLVWNNGQEIINALLLIVDQILNLGGFKSIVLLIYFFLTTTFIFIYALFVPLIEIDKKYSSNEKVKIFQFNNDIAPQFLQGIGEILLFPLIIFISISLLFILEVVVKISTGIVLSALFVLLPAIVIYRIIKNIIKTLKK